MKVLVGGAGLAVLAFAGFFAWSDTQTKQQASLMELAGVSDRDTAKVAVFCNRVEAALTSGPLANDAETLEAFRSCSAAGYK